MMALNVIRLASLLLVFCVFVGFCLGQQCDISPDRRIDCYPEPSPLTEKDCTARNCCYVKYGANLDDNVPWCFFPSDYISYIVQQSEETDYGYSLTLKLGNTTSVFPPNKISTLKMDIFLETPQRLHFKIYDTASQRYEVPIETPVVPKKTTKPTLYSVKVAQKSEPFSVLVKRAATNIALFDSSIGPLLFGDQFLQISTTLASANIYGLGERHGRLRPDVYWTRVPFWASDHAPGFPQGGNLYGDHPFYMVMEPDGRSHGVFFLNSNAKEAALQPEPALTWRSIGGIMDFYVFLGPTPDEVVQQYSAVVGRTHMPPYWVLGFHLCRFGYKSSNLTMMYVEKMRKAGIPQDVQWNDIDYMDSHLDFTYDKKAYDTLPDVVQDLHDHGQHYVMIVDPGISDKQPRGAYPPYDDGAAAGIFVEDASGKFASEGVVWPGPVTFPDFTHPNVEKYWLKQFQSYHSSIPFDGAWIDMNELSNFQDGSPKNCYANSTLDYPPYVPRLTGDTLFARTLCPSSKQFKGRHYDVHSLTGLMEMKATSRALMSLRKKRPFVISRSTFPSAGLYGGHWTGDIKSTWEHMKLTIPGILGFNMFAVPLVGADICGFGGDTTEELCTRWSQLGAFYPFSRNHNDLKSIPQAPVDFSETTQNIIRNALKLRYSLLPYLYTLFFLSHAQGSTVARPLFFEFPDDTSTYGMDEQFLWGSALLITPVLDEKVNKVKGYFPKGIWYDIYSTSWGQKIVSKGELVNLEAPIELIPLHIRGGSIIPQTQPATLTNIKNPLSLLVAPDENGRANGTLYWDDGDSLDTFKSKTYAYFNLLLTNDTLDIASQGDSVTFLQTMHLDKICVLGMGCAVKHATVNGKEAAFSVRSYNVVEITANVPFQKQMRVTWSCM